MIVTLIHEWLAAGARIGAIAFFSVLIFFLLVAAVLVVIGIIGTVAKLLNGGDDDGLHRG